MIPWPLTVLAIAAIGLACTTAWWAGYHDGYNTALHELNQPEPAETPAPPGPPTLTVIHGDRGLPA